MFDKVFVCWGFKCRKGCGKQATVHDATWSPWIQWSTTIVNGPFCKGKQRGSFCAWSRKYWWNSTTEGSSKTAGNHKQKALLCSCAHSWGTLGEVFPTETTTSWSCQWGREDLNGFLEVVQSSAPESPGVSEIQRCVALLHSLQDSLRRRNWFAESSSAPSELGAGAGPNSELSGPLLFLELHEWWGIQSFSQRLCWWKCSGGRTCRNFSWAKYISFWNWCEVQGHDVLSMLGCLRRRLASASQSFPLQTSFRMRS